MRIVGALVAAAVVLGIIASGASAAPMRSCGTFMYKGFPIGVKAQVTTCKVARSVAFRATQGVSTRPYRCVDVTSPAVRFHQRCRAVGGRRVDVFEFR